MKPSAAFLLAGVRVGLHCQSGESLAQLSALWRQFFYVEPAEDPDPALSFSFAETGPSETKGEEIYRTETLHIAKTGRGFLLRCDNAWLELDLNQSRGEGGLPDSFWHLSAYDQREFFLLALLMLLRPHGLYGLHANGLAKGERGLLIVGPSGSGKTTLTLSLLRQGWQVLSDDAVLLKDAKPLYAYAFRRGFSITSQTERFFSTTREEAMYRAQDKRVLDAETLYPEQFTPRLEPRLILFPEVSERPESTFSSLSPSEALIALVQQSAGSMVGKVAAARQLELLKRLVQTSSCYRFFSGRDVVERGSAVSAKLKTLLDMSYG